MKNWTVRWLLLATGVALGLGMPLGKMAGAAGIGALSFALVPALGATAVLALLAWRQHGALVCTGRWPRLTVFGLVAGLLGNAIPNTLTAWLSVKAGAGLTGLAYSLPPVFTLVLLMVLRFERWRAVRVLAVLIGLAGALWLVSAQVRVGGLSVLTATLMLSVPLAIGAGNVFRTRALPAGVPPLWLGAAMAAGASLWLLPAWLVAPQELSALSSAGLPVLAVQALMAASGAALFFQLQVRTEPVTMSFVGYVIALTAVIFSALLLDERLPAQLLPAALLIGSGFWLIQRTATRP